jgi:hypothetical protein
MATSPSIGAIPQVMATIPHPLIDSVCGRSAGARSFASQVAGWNETHRVKLPKDMAVVIRVEHRPVPRLTDELLSSSIQRLMPGRSLDEFAGELPVSDLERLVMDGDERLARVHSVVPTAASGTSSAGDAAPIRGRDRPLGRCLTNSRQLSRGTLA